MRDRAISQSDTAGSQHLSRVLVWAHVHGANQGDELVIETVIDALRARTAGVEVVTVSMAPAKSEQRHGVPSIAIGSISSNSREPAFLRNHDSLRLAWRRARNVFHEAVSFATVVRVIRGFDTLVIAGSHPLADDPGSTYRVAKWVTLARLCRTRALILSVGCGPLDRRLHRVLTRIAVRIASYVSVRDQSSLQHLQATGVHRDVPIVPDMGWVWPPLLERDHARSGVRSDVTVGVNLMAIPQDQRGAHGGPDEEDKWPIELRETFDAYVKAMREVVVHVLERGHRVQWFSSETGHDALLQRAVHRSFVEELPALAERIDVVEDPRESALDVLDLIEDLDIVVATRYHTALLALGLGRPTIGVAYSAKTSDLFRELGAADLVFPLHSVSGAQLIDCVDLLLERAGAEDPIARSRREEIRRSVLAQFDTVFGPAA